MLRSKCANHRSVRLIPIVSKLLSSVILRRLYNTRKGKTREKQARFCTGCGFVDQIITVYGWAHRFTFQRLTVIVFCRVRQDCSIFPFLFNFVIEDILSNALFDVLDGGVELPQRNRDFDLHCSDDIACCRLAIEVSSYNVRCTFEMQGAASILARACACVHLCDDRFEIINSFMNLWLHVVDLLDRWSH